MMIIPGRVLYCLYSQVLMFKDTVLWLTTELYDVSVSSQLTWGVTGCTPLSMPAGTQLILKHSVVIFKQGHPTTWLFVFPRIISTLMTIPSLMYLGWMNSFELHFSKVFVKCYSLWESNSNFEIRNGNQSTTTNKLDASKSISKKSIQSGVAQLQVNLLFILNFI